MFFLGKKEAEPLTESPKIKGVLKRYGSFSSREVFKAWARDSLLKESTIDLLANQHEIDSLPAVLALKDEDISSLGLPIGQRRLFEEAVRGLHKEYQFTHAETTVKTPISLETAPVYKTLLADVFEFDETASASSEVKSGATSPRQEERLLTEKKEKIPTEKEHLSDSDDDIEEKKDLPVKDSAVKECSKSTTTTSAGHQYTKLEQGEEATEKPLEEQNTGSSKFLDETLTGCGCQRWLFITLAFPLLILGSLLGLLFMLLLAPFYICCSETACFDRLWAGVWKNLVRLPANGIHWATGRNSHHHGSSESINGQETKTYGGTDLEMGDKKS